MKPKAPKKKDPTPNCKTGEVKEYISINHIFNDIEYIKGIKEQLKNMHNESITVWLENNSIHFMAGKSTGYLVTDDVIKHYLKRLSECDY